MNIILRMPYRMNSRSVSFTKKSWEKHVLPILTRYHAKVNCHLTHLGLIEYRVEGIEAEEALTLRKALEYALCTLGYKTWAGFNVEK